jgi:hypothetical protein
VTGVTHPKLELGWAGWLGRLALGFAEISPRKRGGLLGGGGGTRCWIGGSEPMRAYLSYFNASVGT